MSDDDFNFIYGIVDELWINVSKIITKKALDGNMVNNLTHCNLKAVHRLLEVQ